MVLVGAALMPRLFSYGTLQQEDVQIATFGRVLAGEPDELVGFAPSLVKIDDPHLAAHVGRSHHANVTFDGERSHRVSGTVFEVTEAELAAADRYEETAAYTRISVTLASGKPAWLYVHRDTVPDDTDPKR
jgi:hypothetical protein